MKTLTLENWPDDLVLYTALLHVPSTVRACDEADPDGHGFHCSRVPEHPTPHVAMALATHPNGRDSMMFASAVWAKLTSH